MSIRLDPRRLGHLKQLAGEAGVRPGDLVRQWVEERIDVERGGAAPAIGSANLVERVDELTARVAALEISTGIATEPPAAAPEAEAPEAEAEAATADAATGAPPAEPEAEPSAAADAPTPKKRQRRASAAPSGKVALHDEIIAVIRERGPMTSGELADAIAERGRYTPPRSGKPLDAAMVSQRVSNPTYRGRFVRNEGRIGLADE